MFERLQAYKHEYNTCNVSKRCRTDPKLGHWVHYQRIMYKAEKLCQDRKDLLESIGFVWSERKTSKITREYTSWDERFQGAYIFIAFRSVYCLKSNLNILQ